MVRAGESVDLAFGCGERPGTFRGEMVDETGRPLAWVASLRAGPDEVAGVASSGPDGDAVVADLPSSWYRLEARLGSTTWQWPSGFEVVAGKTMLGQYRLGSRTVRGRLEWPADRPRPERPRIVVTPAADPVGGWTSVAPSGDFTIDGAMPGTYVIECATGEGEELLLARARVDVPRTADVSGVELKFRRTGALAIDVRRPDGSAIPHAGGRLVDEQGIQIPFSDWKAGGDPKLAVFEEGIPEGDYRLLLRPVACEDLESSIRIEGGRANQYVFHVGAEKERAPKVVRAGARTAAPTAATTEEPQAATAEEPEASTEGPKEQARDP